MKYFIKMIQHAGEDTWDNVTLFFPEEGGIIRMCRFHDRNELLGIYRLLCLEEGKGHENPFNLLILDKEYHLPYELWTLMLEYFEDWFQNFMRLEECLGDDLYFPDSP